MNKKNYIIDYTLFDRRGNSIKTGTIKSRYKVNEADAIIGASGYLKGVYPDAVAILVHSCKEDRPQQDMRTTIIITVSVGTVAS